MTQNTAVAEVQTAPLKIDIGCGANKQAGFIGVDQYDLPGVDVVCNLASGTWPWEDNSVEAAHCSHFIEHLTNLNDKWERVHFFNELYRVLAPGASCTLIFPHWASTRYYGDPTHKEPFSEMGFYYLSKEWRLTQAIHTDSSVNSNGYSCDFAATWGNGMHQELLARSEAHQQYAMQWYKEAIQDLHATLTKK
jgi:ubiquinone/menaquinone biosynthesis C-methylase UbiE